MRSAGCAPCLCGLFQLEAPSVRLRGLFVCWLGFWWGCGLCGVESGSEACCLVGGSSARAARVLDLSCARVGGACCRWCVVLLGYGVLGYVTQCGRGVGRVGLVWRCGRGWWWVWRTRSVRWCGVVLCGLCGVFVGSAERARGGCAGGRGARGGVGWLVVVLVRWGLWVVGGSAERDRLGEMVAGWGERE